MDLAGTQVINLAEVNLDLAVTDELEKVGVVVENAEAGCGEHGWGPWLQLRHLRMGVICIETHDVATEDSPEGIHDEAADESAVEEALDAGVTCSTAVDTRAEPCEEAHICS